MMLLQPAGLQTTAMDANHHRSTLITTGLNRLLTSGIDALRSQLNASVLSGGSPVSRDTAYRVFRGDPTYASVADAIVAAVTEAAHERAWTGYDAAMRDAMEAYEAALREDADTPTAMKAVLRAIFEANARAPGLPVTWVLQSAAFAASEAWSGDPPADDDAELARFILATRRQAYGEIELQTTALLGTAMSLAGRRPLHGFDLTTISRLLHALLDGLLVRRFVDPEALAPELATEAMYHLVDSLTETGPVDDPRKPDDVRGQGVFDRLVEAAGELWAERPEITVEDTAERAAMPLEAAVLIFPTVGDLADSFLRTRVVGGGFSELGPLPSDATVNHHLAGLVTELRTLRSLADELPHAIAAAQRHRPARSPAFADDFVATESRVVAAVNERVDATGLVRDLLTFASQGTPGWPAVTALLRIVGYETS